MRKCLKCGFETENNPTELCEQCGAPYVDNEIDEAVSSSENDAETGNDQQTAAAPENPVENGDAGEPVYTSEWLKTNTDIRGWLSFFCWMVLLGGLFSAVYHIVTYDAADYNNIVWLGAVDVFTGLLLLGVGAYTVYAFRERKPNAIFYARFYLIIIIVFNVLGLLGKADENGMGTFQQLVRYVACAVAWLSFLHKSKQVQSVIPKSFRKVSALDKKIVGTLIAIPVICFFIGCVQMVRATIHNPAVWESVIETQNEKCPVQWAKGMTLTHFSVEEDYLVGNIEVDESLYSIAALNTRKEQMEESLVKDFFDASDSSTDLFIKLCKEAGKGVALKFIGNSSGEVCMIKVLATEL